MSSHTRTRLSASKRPLQRFAVYRLYGATAELVCYVKVADADAAIARVIRDYGIDDPTEQARLFARPA